MRLKIRKILTSATIRSFRSNFAIGQGLGFAREFGGGLPIVTCFLSCRTSIPEAAISNVGHDSPALFEFPVREIAPLTAVCGAVLNMGFRLVRCLSPLVATIVEVSREFTPITPFQKMIKIGRTGQTGGGGTIAAKTSRAHKDSSSQLVPNIMAINWFSETIYTQVLH